MHLGKGNNINILGVHVEEIYFMAQLTSVKGALLNNPHPEVVGERINDTSPHAAAGSGTTYK